MAYTILRFKKDKGGAVAGCERHNERKKEAYKSNPDIDINKSKDNYHIIQAPKYTYSRQIKELIKKLKKTNKNIETNIFTSMNNVNLECVLGYRKGDEKHSFLDDYEE